MACKLALPIFLMIYGFEQLTARTEKNRSPSFKPQAAPTSKLSTRSIPKYAFWDGDRLTYRFSAVNFFDVSHPMFSKIQSCLDANELDTKSDFFADWKRQALITLLPVLKCG